VRASDRDFVLLVVFDRMLLRWLPGDHFGTLGTTGKATVNTGGRAMIWLTVIVTLFLLGYLLVALLRPERF
jgi:K+-transporting ATPase KdpF subunit